MTITAQIAYIKEHPYYEVAKRDDGAMTRLLFEVMFHTYQTCSANCARAYRQARRMNGPQVLEAIRDCSPPENLDVRLPFVMPEPEVVPVCVVTDLPRTVVSRKCRVSVDCRQLRLWA